MNVSLLKRLLVSAALLLVAHGYILAQSSPETQGLTAEEYYNEAENLYATGKYAEAASVYQKLLSDYGESKEIAQIIRGICFRRAICLIQVRKFDEALEAIDVALKQQPPLSSAEIQELQFWSGVARMEEKDYPGAREVLEKFLTLFPAGAERKPSYIQQFPAAAKISEARLLIGSAWLLEEKYKEAAEYYVRLKPDLIPENRARAVVLELYALLQANENEAAMKVLEEEYARMGDLIQLITFQSLTLELGNRWLEKGEYRKAIGCFQRVWASGRLLRHQEARLEELESRLQAVEANSRGDSYTKFLLSQLIQKVKREVENFQKVVSFDAALRLRLAAAYQVMKRYREAALILEEMLDQMPPDKVVEQAAVNLVQCWNEIERWPKTIEAAQAFVKKFPQSASVPLVLYLEGLAQQKNFQYNDAVATFENLAKKYPKSEFAPRAEFMRGYTLLQAERNTEGAAAFENFLKTYPHHELADAAAYWRGMSYSLDKQFSKCREAMDEYLAQYKDGQFRGNAVYRKAYCAQQMEDYQTSIKELRDYMRAYPGHEENGEARILLGDALMNEGQMEEGIAYLKGIPKSEARFYEEGIFKIGKAYKLMEEYDKLRDLMLEFKEGSPRSPRVAEAIYNIGWVFRQQNQPEKARDIYWEAIREYGDDPGIRSVDDLFPALARLYKGPEESAQYLARLDDLTKEADSTGKKTLAMRALWAQAQAQKRSAPARSQEILVQTSSRADVQTTNPLLLTDFAEALLENGQEKEAEQMFRDLVKWNPRAPQKDRALAHLGLMEMKRGNNQAALAYFERFERETLGSLLFGQVLLAKAQLLEDRGRKEDALKALEAILANQFSNGKEKAEALFRIGQIHMAQGKPQLAVPYYQRIYVMYGRWGEWVAKAYLRSGEAFEELKDTQSARKTYQELIEKEDLARFPETTQAKGRLETLGGPMVEEPSKG